MISEDVHCTVSNSIEKQAFIDIIELDNETKTYIVPDRNINLSELDKLGEGKVCALTVDVFVKGCKPSGDYNRHEIKVEPKWSFHLNLNRFCELMRTGKRQWNSTTWINDGTDIALLMTWTFDRVPQVEDNVIASLKKRNKTAEYYQDLLRSASKNRCESVIDSVKRLCKDRASNGEIQNMTFRACENFFRIPNPLSPVYQREIKDLASFKQQASVNLKSAMDLPDMNVETAHMIDYEQAMCMAESIFHNKKDYWAPLALNCLMTGMIMYYDIREPLDPHKPIKGIGHIREQLEETNWQCLNDYIFRAASQLTAAHARYTPDTGFDNSFMTENALTKLSLNQDGESQLISGIPFKASKYVRQKKEKESNFKSNLPMKFKDCYEFGGDLFPFDCEDGSYMVFAIMSFFRLLSCQDIIDRFHACSSRFEDDRTFFELLSEILPKIKESDRQYFPTLGIALARNVEDNKGNHTKRQPVRTHEQHFRQFENDLENHTGNGHSWTCGFKLCEAMRFGPAIICYIEDLIHQEQTSFTVDLKSETDVQREVSFYCSNTEILHQLGGHRQTMQFSEEMSCRNDIMSQIIQETENKANKAKNIQTGTKLHSNGIQYQNNECPNGFLQSLIQAGGCFAFGCNDKDIHSVSSISPTMSVPGRYPKIMIRVPAVTEERQACDALMDCAVNQFPSHSALPFLPPECLKYYGDEGKSSILHSINSTFTNYDELMQNVKNKKKSFLESNINCCGFRILSAYFVIFYFESNQ